MITNETDGSIEKYYIVPYVNDMGFLCISTRELYHQFDRGKYLVLEADNLSRHVLLRDYQGFTCNDDYSQACFKPDLKGNVLNPYNLKLLDKFHHEWYNSLRDYLNSKEFISILTQVGALRKVKEILPPQEQQFTPFLERIYQTVIPDTLTSNSGDVWKPFVEKCRDIQRQVIAGRTKFSY